MTRTLVLLWLGATTLETALVAVTIGLDNRHGIVTALGLALIYGVAMLACGLLRRYV